MRIWPWWLILLVFAASPQERPERVGPATATVSDLAVADRVVLSKAANGIDGELQLLEDARVTPSLQEQLWGTGEADRDVVHVRESVLSGGPLRHATVRIIARDQTVLDSVELERPLARLEHTRLYGDRHETYLVTVDYDAGSGSYSGPITTFVDVAAGHLAWLEATDRATGTRERIHLMHSLKTTWRFVPSSAGAGRRAGQQILEALCRPAFESGEGKFTLTYRRYFFDGKTWVRLAREQPGFAEFDEGFPARRLFP